MSDENKDIYKIILVGETNVGKTCIITQFIEGKFEETHLATISHQFCRKNFDLPLERNITMDIWDTVGQERFRSLSNIYYKDAKAVIVVYDITNKESFNEVKDYWYNQIKENSNKDVIIAIAANKSDLYETREVSIEEGEEFAKSIDAIFASTSAKNDTGITNLFENIAMKILDSNVDIITNEQKKEEYKSIKRGKKGGNENNKHNTNTIAEQNSIKKNKKKCC